MKARACGRACERDRIVDEPRMAESPEDGVCTIHAPPEYRDCDTAAGCELQDYTDVQGSADGGTIYA